MAHMYTVFLNVLQWAKLSIARHTDTHTLIQNAPTQIYTEIQFGFSEP